jgi:hypothetical protein
MWFMFLVSGSFYICIDPSSENLQKLKGDSVVSNCLVWKKPPTCVCPFYDIALSSPCSCYREVSRMAIPAGSASLRHSLLLFPGHFSPIFALLVCLVRHQPACLFSPRCLERCAAQNIEIQKVLFVKLTGI